MRFSPGCGCCFACTWPATICVLITVKSTPNVFTYITLTGDGAGVYSGGSFTNNGSTYDVVVQFRNTVGSGANIVATSHTNPLDVYGPITLQPTDALCFFPTAGVLGTRPLQAEVDYEIFSAPCPGGSGPSLDCCSRRSGGVLPNLTATKSSASGCFTGLPATIALTGAAEEWLGSFTDINCGGATVNSLVIFCEDMEASLYGPAYVTSAAPNGGASCGSPLSAVYSINDGAGNAVTLTISEP